MYYMSVGRKRIQRKDVKYIQYHVASMSFVSEATVLTSSPILLPLQKNIVFYDDY